MTIGFQIDCLRTKTNSFGKVKLTMRFILGVLWGYYIRQKAVADHYAYRIYGGYPLVLCGDSCNRAFHSCLSLKRERASRSPQSRVPSLIGLHLEAPKPSA